MSAFNHGKFLIGANHVLLVECLMFVCHQWSGAGGRTVIRFHAAVPPSPPPPNVRLPREGVRNTLFFLCMRLQILS